MSTCRVIPFKIRVERLRADSQYKKYKMKSGNVKFAVDVLWAGGVNKKAGPEDPDLPGKA
jgi:hypothetical protein